MNYLAHAYLSFNIPGILAGNMISDFVKGKAQYNYTAEIQKGIRLHRLIDAFTDEHETTKQAKQVFKPFVGLYAGAFMDVAYDHFLAKDENEFPGNSLAEFSQNTYATLYSLEALLPQKFVAMLPYMSRHNWLFNYRTMDGIEKSFAGVVRRAAYLNTSADVFAAFIEHYDAFENSYHIFFPQVKAFASQALEKL